MVKGGKCPYQWTLTFFGLPSSYRKDLHQEIFTLVYYAKGFTHDDIYTMPIYLRRFYSEALLSEKEKEKQAIEKSQRQNNSPSRFSTPNQ